MEENDSPNSFSKNQFINCETLRSSAGWSTHEHEKHEINDNKI